MLAMIGSALIVVGTYAFFAVRMPVALIGAVVTLGLFANGWTNCQNCPAAACYSYQRRCQ